MLILTDRRVLGLPTEVFLQTGQLDVDLGRADITGAHVTRA